MPAAPAPEAVAPAPAPEPEAIPDAAEEVVEGSAEEETPSLSVGVGFRSGLSLDVNGKSADPTAADSGTEDAPQLALNSGVPGGVNVRPYLGGQVHENIAFEVNLEGTMDGISVLDAVAKFQLHELFNVWAGQFLPPSSRSNLSGPYYLNAFNFPLFVHAFPFEVAGRDRGVAAWGQVGGGMFKYQLGLFDLDAGNPVENSRFGARVVLNLLDPEPGYYNSSTYYGAKDVLAIGATFQVQDAYSVDDMGVPLDDADDSMLGVQFDLLFEKNLGDSGVVDVEGSVWIFDTDPGYLLNAFNGVPGLQFKGVSSFVLLSWMTADEVGVGHLQPQIRLQTIAPDGGDAEHLVDGGLNYIIDGYNARVSLLVAHNTQKEATSIQLGTQLQMW